MKIKLELDICPFDIPLSVTVIQKPGMRQDGFKPSQAIYLNDLDINVLEALCDDFKDRIMKARLEHRDRQIRHEDPTGY